MSARFHTARYPGGHVSTWVEVHFRDGDEPRMLSPREYEELQYADWIEEVSAEPDILGMIEVTESLLGCSL